MLVLNTLFSVFQSEYLYRMMLVLLFLKQSGKLVMKMFQKIQELIDDKDALVCVLIDEV